MTSEKAADYPYKKSRNGITAVIIHRKKVLLLKRSPLLFFAAYPGIWTVVGGGIKSENPLDAAYREIEEETRIAKRDLRLLSACMNFKIYDPIRRNAQWRNTLFFFKSRTARVKLNFENSRCRWASFDDIKKERDYTSIFMENARFLDILKRHLV